MGKQKARDDDDGDWNRGLNAWHGGRGAARGTKWRGDSLNPDDSNSNLNDKIDVTEWSDRGTDCGGVPQCPLSHIRLYEKEKRREEREEAV